MTARHLAYALLAGLFAIGASPSASSDDGVMPPSEASAAEELGAALAEKPAVPEEADSSSEDEEPIYIWRGQLMTPEEREAHYEKIKSLKTRNEVKAYRAENRAKIAARARELGLTIVDGRARNRPALKIATMGGIKGTATSKTRDLMPPEELEEYLDKMQSLETEEEREALRDEQRKKIRERARESGVSIPREPGAPGGHIVGSESSSP